MSLVDQQVPLQNLVPLLRSTNIEGFKNGTIFFPWLWRCTTHLGMIWIVSSGNVLIFSMMDDREVILSFCIQIFRQHVNIVLQHDLASTIERKIVLTNDAYFRPPITIRSHNLHVGDIRGVMGEITSYHERDQLSPSFWVVCLRLPHSYLPLDGFGHHSFFGFLC